MRPTPLLPKSAREESNIEDTESDSVVKSEVKGAARSSICEPYSESKCATTGKKKKMRVQFSPYNEVQLMSPRRTFGVFATQKRLEFESVQEEGQSTSSETGG
mmetsp:Transcript_3863/g.3243  ORF Transcript_3863/g.3243 Transcript_3863/m.3243 type:complete len:103 (+) Transcript_3863:89-397(+)